MGGMKVAEHMDKEAFLAFLKSKGYSMASIKTIREYPAADVAPVKHGKWETNSDRPDKLICSVCKCGFDMWKHDPHRYCPNCGAKMNGGDEDVKAD